MAYVVSTGVAQVEVPAIDGGDTTSASAALDDAGLGGSATELNSDTVPAGEVFGQAPAAGTMVDVGSTVSYNVSLGPSPEEAIPSVRNASPADAQAMLEDAGFVVNQIVEQTSENVAAGDAVKTDPAADEQAAVGSQVVLYVSTGSNFTTVPDVRNFSEGDATALLADAGLGVSEIRDQSHNNVDAGNAIRTDPAAESEVEIGSDVILSISTGPTQVAVPDIVDIKQKAAKTAITDAGLNVGTSSSQQDDRPRNTVLSQEPAAGTMVDEGSAVDYVLSSGPATVAVPEVRDLGEGDANAAITDAGLTVSETTSRPNNNVAAGAAITTEPDAGEQVAPGTPVELILSSGPTQVAVPDIVDIKQKAAKTAITDAGLNVGTSSSQQDDRPRNTVLSQEPAAGTMVDEGSAVDYVLSSGPATVAVPEVRDLGEGDANAAITDAGLTVSETTSRPNNNVAAGAAITTEPDAGEQVEVGSSVQLILSEGPRQALVPGIVGLDEAAAADALATAKLVAGVRDQANSDAVVAGSIISQDPAVDTQVDEGAAVSYVVSLGPVIAPRGAGGTLSVDQVISQLDVVASEVEVIRELALGSTPYDGTVKSDQEEFLRERAFITRDERSVGAEEDALKRLGLLPESADLASLLDDLYGQALRTVYVESRGRLSVLIPADKLNAKQRAAAARDFTRAMQNQNYGIVDARVDDPTEGDAALSRVALEQGDGTAAMLDWSAATLGADSQTKVTNSVVPGGKSLLGSMPPILQREYDLPYLEGRAFVDALRADGGWAAVDGAWDDLPRSTEQIIHPGRYPGNRPVQVSLDGVADRLGGGWSESWRQTMGELRTWVWLADGVAGTQDGPTAPIKLPKAKAATGWGGDRLVSLDGPDGSWAIVWQTAWDGPDDATQFADAAVAAMADLAGANVVLARDIVGGTPAPVLVLVASDADTLASVQASLGVDG